MAANRRFYEQSGYSRAGSALITVVTRIREGRPRAQAAPLREARSTERAVADASDLMLHGPPLNGRRGYASRWRRRRAPTERRSMSAWTGTTRQEGTEDRELFERRFYEFGLDLDPRPVREPDDWDDGSSAWTRARVSEENLETVFSAAMDVVLPDEELLLIGRQNAAVSVEDLTCLTKGLDVVLFEFKKGEAKPEVIEQGLDYLTRAVGRDLRFYTGLHLRTQRNRKFVDAIRLLGLVQGRKLDLSGPVETRNLERLRAENDSSASGISDEDYLSYSSQRMARCGEAEFDVVRSPKRLLLDRIRERFGVVNDRAIETRVGRSVKLAFVAESFHPDAIEKIKSHYRRGTFFHAFEARLYRQDTPIPRYLLSVRRISPDVAVRSPRAASLRLCHQKALFLDSLQEQLIAIDCTEPRSSATLPMWEWMWDRPRYDRLEFRPGGWGPLGELVIADDLSWKLRWSLEWTNDGSFRRLSETIATKAGRDADGMSQVTPAGTWSYVGPKESLSLDRSGAREFAEWFHGVLLKGFELYGACGVWDDVYGYYRDDT